MSDRRNRTIIANNKRNRSNTQNITFEKKKIEKREREREREREKKRMKRRDI